MSSEAQLQYHSVIPTNLKSSYTPFDNVDFDLSAGEGRSLNLGSVCIEGELQVLQNGARLTDQQIFLDPLTGAHSLFEMCTVAINGGANVIENMNELPRYTKMAMSATLDQGDTCNSDNSCELKAPTAQMTNDLLKGEIPNEQPTLPLFCNPDFSVKPLICLNSSNETLSYSKTGDIRITLNLARNFAVLYGYDVDSTTEYSIQDLRIVFTSSPDDGSSDPVGMKTKQYIKQSIQSNFANVQTRANTLCTGMTASFQVQAEENNAKNNNLALQKVPNLRQTQYLFNDQTNSLVSYIIKNNVEVVERGIRSMMDTDKNSLSTQKLANNDGFLLGLDFDQVLNLKDNSFSLQLTSDISSQVPMIIHQYFHSAIQV